MRSKSAESLNLDVLNQAYEILGELAARKDARQFVAKRRSDGSQVTLAVFQAPAGDQGNAISHLAADANRLIGNQHANLIPVLDGQWVGTDAFAIATPRIDAPTLEEMLSRREEDFSFARIALILREINAVIEWARSQKFVHRAVDLDTVHLAPGSDQLRIGFAVRALPRTGIPTAIDDARTIASLARAMLTRSPGDPQRDEQPLAELRPGLPTSLLQETEVLLRGLGHRAGHNGQQRPGATDIPDVTAYISRLAMAEDLKRGEMHLEKSRNAIKEAHRKAKEEIEANRKAHETQLAAARAEHERLVAEQARAFAKERSEFEAELEKQREALFKERETLATERTAHARAAEALAQEREAHKRDCEALGRERAAHKQDSAALTAQLADHRRLMADERKRLSAQIMELQQQASEERKRLLDRVNAQLNEAAEERKSMAAQLDTIRRQTVEERMQAAALLAARLEEQKRLAAKEKKRTAEQLAVEKHRADEERKRLAAQFATVAASGSRSAPVPPTPPKPQKPQPPKPPKPARVFQWNRAWNMPAAAAGVLLLLAGITFAASAGRDDTRSQTEVTKAPAAALVTSAPPASSTAPNVVIDSMGGGIMPTVDSTRATITARPRTTAEPERPRVVDVPPPRPETPAAPVEVPTPSAFDLMGVSPIPLREGNTRLDSIGRPARDTLRRDSRRDSLPRIDSIPRRDSTRSR
jgi:hypothetical protein